MITGSEVEAFSLPASLLATFLIGNAINEASLKKARKQAGLTPWPPLHRLAFFEKCVMMAFGFLCWGLTRLFIPDHRWLAIAAMIPATIAGIAVTRLIFTPLFIFLRLPAATREPSAPLLARVLEEIWLPRTRAARNRRPQYSYINRALCIALAIALFAGPIALFGYGSSVVLGTSGWTFLSAAIGSACFWLALAYTPIRRGFAKRGSIKIDAPQEKVFDLLRPSPEHAFYAPYLVHAGTIDEDAGTAHSFVNVIDSQRYVVVVVKEDAPAALTLCWVAFSGIDAGSERAKWTDCWRIRQCADDLLVEYECRVTHCFLGYYLFCIVSDFATEQLVCLKAEAEDRDNPTHLALHPDAIELGRLRFGAPRQAPRLIGP